MCAEVAGGITFGILAGTLSAMLTESNASQQEAQEQVGIYSSLLYSTLIATLTDAFAINRSKWIHFHYLLGISGLFWVYFDRRTTGG